MHSIISKTNVIKRVALSTLAALSLSALTACAPASSNLSNGYVADDTTREGDEVAPPASPELLEKIASFTEPVISENEIAFAAEKYSFVDPNSEVPSGLKSKALAYYEANKSKLDNTKYLTVVDFSKNSAKSRMFVINMSTGSVWSMHVAHGEGSDRNNDGLADKFSNTNGSNMSSLGYYLTAETYSGKHGYSLRLDGLSSTNSAVRNRAIVVHGADYVNETNSRQGRSWGCLAVTMSYRTKLVDMIKGGSLIYASN